MSLSASSSDGDLSPRPTAGNLTPVQHGCCITEKTAATITLIVMLCIAIAGALALIAILHPNIDSLSSFFAKMRAIVSKIATQCETTPLNVSFFVTVIGGVGSVCSLIWRGSISCHSTKTGNAPRIDTRATVLEASADTARLSMQLPLHSGSSGT